MPEQGLSSLPVEVVLEILEYLEESPRALRAFAKIDRRFNQISKHVKPLIHREEEVLYTLENKDGFPRFWLSDVDVLQGIRRLIVNNPRQWHQGYGANRINYVKLNFAPLVELIDSIPKLDTIIWGCQFPIPLRIVDAIHKHTATSLIITRYMRIENLPIATALQCALEESHALTFIRLDRQIDTMPWDVGYFNSMRRIIQRAPNLQGASFLYGPLPPYERYSEVLPDELKHIHRRDLEAESFRPPTTAFRSLTYRDHTHGPSWSLRLDADPSYWSLPNYDSPENLERFNTPHAMIRDEQVQPAFESLTRLKEIDWDLRFLHSISCETFTAHLTNHQPLEVLRLRNWTNRVDLPEALSFHGSTLEVLELHNVDETRIPWRAMSVETLTLIKDHCPKLVDLTFDICPASDRLNLTDHYDLFEVLATMRLRNVKIFVELSSFPALSTPPPNLISASQVKPYVASVWKTVFRDILIGQKRELNMLFGPFCSEMVESIGSSWKAVACERDDMVGKCLVWCDCSLPDYFRVRDAEVTVARNQITAEERRRVQEGVKERRKRLSELRRRAMRDDLGRLFGFLVSRPAHRMMGLVRQLLPSRDTNE